MGGGPSRVECVLPFMLDTENASGSETNKSELLQWRVGASPSKIASLGHAISDHFQLLDVEQRVEVRRSGSYRLRLHIEQQESKTCVPSKFSVEINGNVIPMYRESPTENSASCPPKSVDYCSNSTEKARPSCTRADHAAEITPCKYFGVAEVNLDRCDTIAVRRTMGNASKNQLSSNSKLLFGRLVVEAIRTSP